MYSSQPIYQMTESTQMQVPVMLNSQPSVGSINSISTGKSSYLHQGELTNSVPRTRTVKPRVSKTSTVVTQERRPSSFDPFLDKENHNKFVAAGKALMLGYLTKMIAEKMVMTSHTGKNKTGKQKKGLIKKLAKTFFVVESAKKLIASIESDPTFHSHYHTTKANAKLMILERASNLMTTPRVQSLGTGTTLKDKALRLAKGLVVKEINKHMLKSQVLVTQTSQVSVGMNAPVNMSAPMGMNVPMGMGVPMSMSTSVPMGMNAPVGMGVPLGTSVSQQSVIQTGPQIVGQPLVNSHISKSTVAKDILTKNFHKSNAKELMYDLGCKIMDKAVHSVDHTTKY